jgi:hypothetical protein
MDFPLDLSRKGCTPGDDDACEVQHGDVSILLPFPAHQQASEAIRRAIGFRVPSPGLSLVRARQRRLGNT